MPEDYVYTPEEFESMLSQLFSKDRYHGASGALSSEQWREQLTRILMHLQKAIRQSVEGDSLHSRTLQEHCSKAAGHLKTSANCNQLSIHAIMGLTRIAFGLVGHFPDHWDKSERAAAHPANWKLTKYRTLTYHRTAEQRVAQIIALADDPRFATRLPSRRALYQKLGSEFKGDERAFLEWFKSAHSDVYLEVA